MEPSDRNRESPPEPPRAALVTGGAGFIGSAWAARLLRTGGSVTVLDNLSRPGARERLRWLQAQPGAARLEFIEGDVRDAALTARLGAAAGAIYHFAAQVAVTASVEDPRHDCEVNLLGTLNLLEAARRNSALKLFLFSSTNKVYGKLAGPAPPRGFDETQPLDLHSPYGCSKGAAEQYVRDYHRIYGLPSVVFRMSCIYGERQTGAEEQGWVAHFARCALSGRAITVYGDGRQVRDLLHLDDLLAAYELAWRLRAQAVGRIFNLGGGAARARTLLEVVAELERLHGRPLQLRFAEPRPGDQAWYVSDTRSFERVTGWQPRLGVGDGLRRLYRWLAGRRAVESAAPARAGLEAAG